MDEQYYENLLNIKTIGDQKWNDKTLHYHPYEPTLYSALETLFNNYELSSQDHVIDFGCGKGRLNFYINHFYKSYVTGIEMNKAFYEDALNNKINFSKKHRKSDSKINFLCCFAQDYKIQSLDNKFYFFNPFSLQIFMKVVDNILASLEESEREIDIILYYPSEDYIYYLEYCTPFILKNDIIIDSLHKSDERERFVVYNIPCYK